MDTPGENQRTEPSMPNTAALGPPAAIWAAATGRATAAPLLTGLHARTEPLDSSASVKLVPAARALTRVIPSTEDQRSGGNCPLAFEPQESMALSAVRATECVPPAAMETTSCRKLDAA